MFNKKSVKLTSTRLVIPIIILLFQIELPQAQDFRIEISEIAQVITGDQNKAVWVAIVRAVFDIPFRFSVEVQGQAAVIRLL